ASAQEVEDRTETGELEAGARAQRHQWIVGDALEHRPEARWPGERDEAVWFEDDSLRCQRLVNVVEAPPGNHGLEDSAHHTPVDPHARLSKLQESRRV